METEIKKEGDGFIEMFHSYFDVILDTIGACSRGAEVRGWKQPRE